MEVIYKICNHFKIMRHSFNFKVVHPVHVLDKCTQIIAPTECTVLNICIKRILNIQMVPKNV
jgi:hypothetical protein